MYFVISVCLSLFLQLCCSFVVYCVICFVRSFFSYFGTSFVMYVVLFPLVRYFVR